MSQQTIIPSLRILLQAFAGFLLSNRQPYKSWMKRKVYEWDPYFRFPSRMICTAVLAIICLYMVRKGCRTILEKKERLVGETFHTVVPEELEGASALQVSPSLNGIVTPPWKPMLLACGKDPCPLLVPSWGHYPCGHGI